MTCPRQDVLVVAETHEVDAHQRRTIELKRGRSILGHERPEARLTVGFRSASQVDRYDGNLDVRVDDLFEPVTGSPRECGTQRFVPGDDQRPGALERAD